MTDRKIATWIFDVVEIRSGVAVDVTLDSRLRPDGSPFARYVYPNSQRPHDDTDWSPLRDAFEKAMEEFRRSKENYD